MRFGKYKDKMKGMFTKDKVIRFMDKQGFYIVLFVCVALIGVTAFMTSNRGAGPQNIGKNDTGKEQLELAQEVKSPKDKEKVDTDPIDIRVKDTVPEPETVKSEEGTEQKTDKEGNENKELDGQEEVKETLATNTQKETEKTDKVEQPKKEPPVNTKKESSAVMVAPTEGNVMKDHSMDELVYSNTLKEWTTHAGIDIETFVGAEVKAAMGGTVEDITQDPLMGISIILDHGNGLKTYYANLSTGKMVSLGQKVDKGQIISGVGRTASAEILDDPHLHFEVLLEGKSVDPKSYIK
ncbi:MAG TPA: M23 family metallopeptidase [Clostridia bacterium]|nr:M23 family metallopeptidase [Clostridia bacterium]